MAINYTASMGSKLEYSEDNGTTWKPIVGLTAIPEIGAKPSTIDTTTLDNLKFETIIYGLMPAVEFEFLFNMEDPNVEANIATAWGQHIDGVVREWRITYSNGVTHKYKSRSICSFSELPTNEIAKFTMYHAPIEEIVTDIPGMSA